MTTIVETLTSLNIHGYILDGEPTNETEFNSMFHKVTGIENGTQITSDNPDDFGVTWAEVSAKKTELENAEPLKLLRTERNAKLVETDWVVIKEREEGGSVSNFADWKTYRQALRDITDTYTSLDDVVWPEKP